MTLGDVSCLLHLLVRGRLLGHSKITINDALEIIVDYLGADLGDSLKKIYDTRGYHAIFGVLERLYAHLLIALEEVDGDDEHVMEHKPYALRAYMLYMVDTSIF